MKNCQRYSRASARWSNDCNLILYAAKCTSQHCCARVYIIGEVFARIFNWSEERRLPCRDTFRIGVIHADFQHQHVVRAVALYPR